MYQGRLIKPAFFCVIPGLTGDPSFVVGLCRAQASAAATPGACCFAALYG